MVGGSSQYQPFSLSLASSTTMDVVGSAAKAVEGVRDKHDNMKIKHKEAVRMYRHFIVPILSVLKQPMGKILKNYNLFIFTPN
jgi:hypothetical protein